MRLPFQKNLLRLLAIATVTVAVPVRAAEYVVTTVAGARFSQVDGPVATARFGAMGGIVFDANDNLFVTDPEYQTVRMISKNGIVSTLAGRPGYVGWQEGVGANALLFFPERITIDQTGALYVTDDSGFVVQKITPAGLVTTALSTTEVIPSMSGFAVDDAGNLYFSQYSPPVVRRKTIDGTITNYAGQAYWTEGTAYNGVLTGLGGLSFDAAGNLYLAISRQVLKLTPTGVASNLSQDPAPFSSPVALAVSSAGVAFVADQFKIYRSESDGTFSTLVSDVPSQYGSIEGIAIDSHGDLYFSAQHSAILTAGDRGTIYRVSGDKQITAVTDGIQRKRDGAAEAALFDQPTGLLLNEAHQLVVADTNNSAIRIVDLAAGWVTTLADKASTNGAMISPWGLAADKAGNIYVSDAGASVIFQITPAGVVTILAGSPGVWGYDDGSGTAARFASPQALTIDSSGNLYVADSNRVRKITPAGMVTTLAGGAFSGSDGVGANARFYQIAGLAAASDGAVYVVEGGANTIRKVTPDGVVSTYAGKNDQSGTADGVVTEARFSGPRALALDTQGNLYVTESGAIRRITPDGNVTTLWTGADRLTALNQAMAVDASGDIYVTIPLEHVIRKYSSDNVAPVFETEPYSQWAVSGDTVSLTAGAVGSPAPELTWQHNGHVISGASQSTIALANLQPAHTGIYRAIATAGTTQVQGFAAIVGLSITGKTSGDAHELEPHDIHHPNGNVFDQVLLDGAAAAITADYSPDPTQNQITRMSFIDLDDDIVQVEFSGPGTLSLVLENSSGPAAPVNYNQTTQYVKGHAGIVIAGATEQTNVSVFSVGRANAVNQALFKEGVDYDGIADIAFIAISSANGRFGGIRTANVNYFSAAGLTGIYAPGVVFEGPVFVGNISAYDQATPVLQLGYAADVRVTGGDLAQVNGQAVQVSGFDRLLFTAGGTSHGATLPQRPNQAVLVQDREDVTAAVVAYP